MSLGTRIIDGCGTKVGALVTSIGQLVTAPLKYDETTFVELAEAATGYNFYGPKANQQFVITGVYAVADKQVSSSSSADFVVYEASSASTTTESKVLLQSAIVQDQIQFFSGLNILVTEGVYLNAKTSDDDVHTTITGYYIPKL